MQPCVHPSDRPYGATMAMKLRVSGAGCMFTTTTLPPIFQHTAVSSTMALHVPTSGYGQHVAIIRTLRDGTITREYLPQHLAELAVRLPPSGEPLGASARIAYSEL